MNKQKVRESGVDSALVQTPTESSRTVYCDEVGSKVLNELFIIEVMMRPKIGSKL